MTRNTIAALPVTLFLMACSSSQISADNSIQRQPGSWSMLTYTMAMEGTGLTGDMAEMIKAGQASVGKKEISDPVCLTAATVGKDDLAKRLAEAIRLGPEWKTTRSVINASKVDFEAAMDDPAQGEGKMTITGTLSATNSDLIVTSEGTLPSPQKGRIRTVMKTENTRTGDCTPGQDIIG